MKNPPLTKMYEIIGQTVLELQLFESIINISYEAQNIGKSFNQNIKRTNKIRPEILKRFTSRILEDLKKTNDIDENLYQELKNFLNERDILIHQWFRENGIHEDNIKWIEKLTEHSLKVKSKAENFTKIIIESIFSKNMLTMENYNKGINKSGLSDIFKIK